MKWACAWLTIAVFGAGAAAGAQQNVPQQSVAEQDVAEKNVPEKNPLEGNAEAIRNGMGMFRSRCADCHGMDARGVRAPDLTQVWASGRTDAGLYGTVRRGVPGSEMPAFASPRMTPDDVWKILAYLRTVAAPKPTDPARGNAQNGERVFRVHCASCHRASGRGGRLGPDLSRIGLSRTRTAMTRQIRGAVEDFGPGYAPVTLVAPGGQQIHGVKKSEDLFSVQIMDTRERIQGYLREDMKSVTNEKQSAMPVFTVDKLSESDLDDVLAYLSTLRGANTAVSNDNK
ncbi:MAG: c-type cytochrome [Luteitalea sp.]|nr:c-type cytochrome [Luteitalea sp.]